VEAEDLDDGGGVWAGVLVYALSNLMSRSTWCGIARC